MRIGVVTTSYPREPGDPAGAFVAGFARWLARRGHAVSVVAAGPGGARDGDVRVRRVDSPLFYGEGAPDRLERRRASFAGAAWFSARLARAVRQEATAWDAVVSHWLVPCGVLTALGARRRRHLAVAHSGDVHLAARPVAADVVAAALDGAFVAFSGAHLRSRFLGAVRVPPLRRRLAARSAVQPMGIDVAAHRVPRAVRGTAAPAVVFLGRLVPIKGVEVALAAMERVRAVHPAATLVVAGDGPLRASLEARAGAGVRFTGEVRGRERDALFARASVMILPSIDLAGGRTEGTPTVALEALAAGVPLVASDVGGVRDAVGDAAWLVPPADARALADGILAALADPDATSAAAARIAALHDWDTVGPRLLSWLG